MFDLLVSLCTYVGYVVGFYWLTRLFKFVQLLIEPFFCRYLLPRVNLSKYADRWVVFTGATDGVGEAYSTELASRGLRRFLLIGRNADKLRQRADQLKEKFGCEVEWDVFDFAADDLSRLPVEKLRTYDIGILANFAGVAGDRIAATHELHPDANADVIRVNCTVPIRITELCLPGLLARNDGIVVNCGSAGGWRPAKQLGAYPGSKACIAYFTQGLRLDYAHTQLRFQCLMPSLIATKLLYLDKQQASNLFVVNPVDYAREAVDVIGVGAQPSGCQWHDFLVAVFRAAPAWLAYRMADPLMRSHRTRIENVIAANQNERNNNKQ